MPVTGQGAENRRGREAQRDLSGFELELHELGPPPCAKPTGRASTDPPRKVIFYINTVRSELLIKKQENVAAAISGWPVETN